MKLYRDILDDPEWFSLDGEPAKTLVMLWLIASETDGYLPDIKKLSFRLRISEQKVKSLINNLSHWLEQGDITPISEGYRGDAPETETETETEKALSSKPDDTPPKEKKPKAEILEVLNFLNSKTGRTFQPVKANTSLIEARLKEGATVAECRMVIAKKHREWANDAEMSKYLRPATLFNATKFAQYRGELLPVQAVDSDVGQIIERVFA